MTNGTTSHLFSSIYLEIIENLNSHFCHLHIGVFDQPIQGVCSRIGIESSSQVVAPMIWKSFFSQNCDQQELTPSVRRVDYSSLW